MGDKKRQETLSEQKLREEYEKMSKWAKHNPGAEDRLDENQYFYDGSAAGHSPGRSVGTIGDEYVRKFGQVEGMANAIKPKEALELAIQRTLESGAPINNIGFYDEVNLNLQKLGAEAVQPIAIKEAVSNLIKRGME